jgi:hypothetical protein
MQVFKLILICVMIQRINFPLMLRTLCLDVTPSKIFGRLVLLFKQLHILFKAAFFAHLVIDRYGRCEYTLIVIFDFLDDFKLALLKVHLACSTHVGATLTQSQGAFLLFQRRSLPFLIWTGF